MWSQNFEPKLLSAVDGIYATVTGDLSWSEALEGVCDVVGARAADLNVFKADSFEYQSFHPARVDPFVLRYIADYMGDAGNSNPRLNRIYMPMAQGQIVADSDIWAPEDLQRIPFFADFLRPWGTYDSLNTWVRRTPDERPGIALAVHFRNQDGIPQAKVRQHLSQLLPHIRRAFTVGESLAQALQRGSEFKKTLDQLREAVLLVNAQGRITFSNAAAEHLLRKADGIHRSRDEIFQLADTAQQSALQAALERCQNPEALLHAPDAAPVPQILIRSKTGPCVLTIQPLSNMQRMRSQAVAVLLIQAPQISSIHALAPLRSSYGLTPAELQLVHGLINGLSLKQIALNQRVSYQTLRAQLQQVFAKTGTHRQALLIQLARSLC